MKSVVPLPSFHFPFDLLFSESGLVESAALDVDDDDGCDGSSRKARRGNLPFPNIDFDNMSI